MIHLLDTDKDCPEKETMVRMNCGVKIQVGKPIAAQWEDGRVCQRCLGEHASIHAKMLKRLRPLKTFAFMEKEDEHSSD